MQTYVDYRMKDDILIVGISGDLDHHQATRIREEIDKTIETFNCSNLIFDFSNLEFMDSSGIGIVMGRYKKIMEKGGKTAIIGGSKYIQMILEMAGIFTIIDKFKDLFEALESFDSENTGSSELVNGKIEKLYLGV